MTVLPGEKAPETVLGTELETGCKTEPWSRKLGEHAARSRLTAAKTGVYKRRRKSPPSRGDH